MKLCVQIVGLHPCTSSHLCVKLSKCTHEIVLRAVWVHIRSATDHSYVLVPLEILFVCLCKVADSGIVLQHLAGNPEMASQKSDISPSQQARLWTDHVNPLRFPWGSHRKQDAAFSLAGAGSCCRRSLTFVRMPCPQTPSPALLHATQDPTCTPGLASVLVIPANRQSCTVQKSLQLPVSSENISWHENSVY